MSGHMRTFCRPFSARAPRDNHGSRGFCFSELMVVLAAIAILIGLVIGSLGRARELSRTAVCLANLHQLALAANEYAVHNRGAMPCDYFTSNGTWMHELASYVQNMPAADICPDAALPSGGIGTASLAWGTISMAGPPYSPGYPWLAKETGSYGVNNYVSSSSTTGALSSMGES